MLLRRLVIRMAILSAFFLVLLFLPSIFEQFHVEPMLTSASADKPGLVDVSTSYLHVILVLFLRKTLCEICIGLQIPHLSNNVLEVHILGQEADGLTDQDGHSEVEVGVSAIAATSNSTLGGPHLFFLELTEVSEELINLDVSPSVE